MKQPIVVKSFDELALLVKREHQRATGSVDLQTLADLVTVLSCAVVILAEHSQMKDAPIIQSNCRNGEG